MQNAVAVVPNRGLYRGQLVAVMTQKEPYVDGDHGDADGSHNSGRIRPLCPPPSRRTGVESCFAAVSGLLLQRMPTYMIPERWAAVERLPFLSSGKMDRRQVQA